METRTKTHRLLAAMLALTMLGTVLVVPTPVEAGAGPPIRLEDASGNLYTGTFAGRAQTMTFRQVFVEHAGVLGDPAIREVQFSVQESGTSPKQSIEWEGQTSSATGWLDSVNNEDNPNLLIFAAETTAQNIAPGIAKPFNIGFTVFGNPPEGKEFEVKVTARFAGTSDTSESTFIIRIDATPPSVLPTGVITRDEWSGGARRPNGKLDTVIVAFSEPLDPASLNMADLRLAGYSITRAEFFDKDNTGTAIPHPRPAVGLVGSPPRPPTASEVPTTSPSLIIPGEKQYGWCPHDSNGGCAVLKLTIAEGFAYDTGALPQFTTVAANLRDTAGNVMPLVGTTTVTEVDGANPLLVAALAKDLDDTDPRLEGVRLTFSEKVRGTAGLKVACSELRWNDNNVPPAGGRQAPVCPNEWIISHPPGDAAPQQTDLLEIQFGSALDPLNDQDVNANAPDTLECTALVLDLSSSGPSGSGLPCLHDDGDPATTTDPAPVSIYVPNVLDAEVNIDSFKVTVTFNVPVSDASGDTQPVKASAFDIVPTDGGGPQGIDRIEHKACTNIVVLHLDQVVKPTDVDKTPSYVRIQSGAIKGCGGGAAKPLYVPGGDTPLVDATQPAILKAHTVDQNKNGVIDGFFVEFNEPVDDASYCDGTNPCNHQALSGKVRIADPEGLVNLGPTCFPKFRYDTDLADNDRFAMILWDEPDVAAGCPLLDTGFVPHLLVSQKLLTDLARLAASANPLKETTEALLVETDGAAPVILSAFTVDRETKFRDEATLKGTRCVVGLERLCEEDPDGLLDGYRLTFSEAVRDSTFIPREWKVEGHDVIAVTADSQTGDLVNDRRLIVVFEEATRNETGAKNLIHNTDAKPQLTYDGNHFADMAGNLMEAVPSHKLFEEDGARPVIVKVEGFVNQTTLKITFSEPVDDGVGNPLIRSDFVYSNGNSIPPGTKPEDVAALRKELNDRTSGFNNTREVVHRAGTNTAILHLNRALTKEDIMHDRIGANTVSIRESTFSVVDKQFALATLKPLGFSADIVPPGQASGVTVDYRNANAVTLRWRAPGDDGDRNDPVAGYVVKLTEEGFQFFNGTEAWDAVAGKTRNVVAPGIGEVVVGFSPGVLVGPGGVQRMTLAGLQPLTTYQVSVMAFDHDRDAAGVPMFGPSSTILEFTTEADVSVPEGQLLIQSTTHPVNRPVLATKASFQWTKLTDPESTVVYRYKLDNLPETEVTEKDVGTTATNVTIQIPSEGTYYFHVRAFSAAGPQPTTSHYKLIVGPATIEPTAIRDYNLRIHPTIRVVREGDTNVVTWELPDPKDIGDLEAVRIWKLDQGAFVLLHRQPGDYQSLKQGRYVDAEGSTPQDHYMVDAVFATDQQAGTPGLETYRPVDVEYTPKDKMPAWAWFLIAAGILLVVGGIVAFAVVRSRHVPPELAGPGIDEQTGLPSHTARCPSCEHQFQAVGELPLEIQCPECQTKGVLE